MKTNTLKIAAYICAVFTALLLALSFVVPPLGVIDPSALTAAGIMFAFASLFFGWHAFDNGGNAKIKHGETEVEISNDDETATNN